MTDQLNLIGHYFFSPQKSFVCFDLENQNSLDYFTLNQFFFADLKVLLS